MTNQIPLDAQDSLKMETPSLNEEHKLLTVDCDTEACERNYRLLTDNVHLSVEWPKVVPRKLIKEVVDSRWTVLELLKENEILRKQMKCLPCLPLKYQGCPDDPKDFENWLRKRGEKLLREECRFFCQAIRLLMVLCMSIVSNCGKKPRLKNRYEKAVILILWRCGDVERNPGPATSDISRDFCKKMISMLVIRYWESKEGRDLCQADYKKEPIGWPENVWFGDPSTCKNETRNTMLKSLREICLADEVEVPNQWMVLIEKYQTLQENRCDKSQKKQYATDLYSWICQLRSLETTEQLFDRLSDIAEQERDCVLEHVFKRLKQYLPDLSSESLQSRNTEKESIISKAYETGKTATDIAVAANRNSESFDLEAVFTNCQDNGIAESIPAALSNVSCSFTSPVLHVATNGDRSFAVETRAPGILGPDELDSFADLLGDSSPNLAVNWTSQLLSHYAGNSNLGSDVTSFNKDSKRKLDMNVADGDELQNLPPKRHKISTYCDGLLQTIEIKDTHDDARETTLADLMNIIAPEMQTLSDKNFVSKSNGCAQGDDENDTKLLQELGRYLSDEFIQELSSQNSLEL